MNKTSQKVTKNPKPVEAARKGRENYMNKLKESILNDSKKGSRDTSNASNETTSATRNARNETTGTNSTAITRSSDTYVYGVGILLSLPLVFACFLHTTRRQDKSSMNNLLNQNESYALDLYNK